MFRAYCLYLVANKTKKNCIYMDFKVIKTPKRRMNGLSSSIVVNIFVVETINDCMFVFFLSVRAQIFHVFSF